MTTGVEIYIDADACPVKDETLAVARRHGLKTYLVCDGGIRPVPDPLVELVIVSQGADAADDWIAEHIGKADICVTNDIPLAARCLEKDALAIKPNGEVFTENGIGMALANRELMQGLREAGGITGGPSPFSKADRSQFLNRMEVAVQTAMRALAVLFALVWSAPVVQATPPDSVAVSDFAGSGLAGWEERVFKDHTRYTLVEGPTGTVLKADSRASASGLFREMTVNLRETPCLVWSWKVDGVLDGLEETTRGGDDYAARVYVVFSGGPFFWNTRAISYVWSGSNAEGRTWPNAYTDKTTVVVAESGTRGVGRWISEARNVRADYRRLVGEDIEQADAVAVMTDTDNSGKKATAYYADVRFTRSC